MADPDNGAPDNIALAWNLFQPDPIVGPEPVFSVASANYDESGNNIGNNPRIDAGKGLWMGPGYTQSVQNSKFEGAGIGISPSGWDAATSTNNGITDPREAITFPYRVQQITVRSGSAVLDFAVMTCSIIAFEIPIALIG